MHAPYTANKTIPNEHRDKNIITVTNTPRLKHAENYKIICTSKRPKKSIKVTARIHKHQMKQTSTFKLSGKVYFNRTN